MVASRNDPSWGPGTRWPLHGTSGSARVIRTGLPVPQFDDWIARQDRDHPRMREMVMMGRSENRSSETMSP